MNLNDEKQSRFDDLRQRELAGKLTVAEQHELKALTALFIQAADDSLAPAISRLQREQQELEDRLQQRQQENEELTKLLHQQEKLTIETRQWLQSFDRRHAQIRETYTRLTGEVLTPG